MLHISRQFQGLVRYAAVAAFSLVLGAEGCTIQDETQQAANTASPVLATCEGNDNGFYCSNNSLLAKSEDGVYFDTDLIECDNGVEGIVIGCETECMVDNSAPGNDYCASTTCKGNEDGWYCATNPDLNMDPIDEIYDNYLLHCVGDSWIDYKTCDTGCTIRPAGLNDICTLTSSSSLTCDENVDGWYCATNPDLNVDPNDQFSDSELLQCSGGYLVDALMCDYGCTIKSSSLNDVCTPKPVTGSTTCQGNSDGWYCGTNPDLNVDPADEYFDTDLVHCVGGTSTEVVLCSDGCTIKPSGMNDVCTPGVTCGNGMIDSGESCDSSNMNGHTCVTEGFDGGNISCSSCSLNTSLCCVHACTNPTQCVGSVQQTCQDGNGDGCKEWVTTGTCAPTCKTQIVSNTCYTWTSAAGGNEIFEICAQMVSDNRILIHVRKNPISTFGSRPYGMRVFGPADPECSHATSYYAKPQNITLGGVGTSELTMEYDVVWGPGQTAKKYCAYAETVASDVGYDPNNVQQDIWWYSKSLQVSQVCN